MLKRKSNIPANAIHIEELEKTILTAINDETTVNFCHFKNETLIFNTPITVDFKNCIFEKCKIVGLKFEKSSFINVEFNSCDFSGSLFSSCLIRNADFLQCKGAGSQFTDSIIDNTYIENSRFNLSTFFTTSFKKTSFLDTDFQQSQFSECKLSLFTCRETSFIQAEFLRTSLANVDLTSCTIDGMRITPADIRGAVVTSYQACGLARLLGITIKD